ncbi:unnamed protein product [Penicillium nalgiovense]|uniref:Uncharacterized protein n=3 Tax=Penicillium TaxID=5073 RepID=A0A9W4N547_9EURO|nr:unnamed protein product [Penicillium salamii]CAG7952888.1 unnamed protein product [Penicillium nalgiovense]CRL31230.1 Protein of unknown function DUF952 [Penicillium camemberti]CAG7937717.1 unnamed protein product [Penicillium salamii]CAG7937771.1 unnamed protein product [Penicillium salamii]
MANLTSFYIYKVIPSTCPVREPLPERLPVSRGDQDSGFIRLLTARQVPIALKTIFKSEPMVYILRILYKKIMQDILWEPADGAVSEALPEEAFCPHLYNGLNLGQDHVESMAVWINENGWEEVPMQAGPWLLD